MEPKLINILSPVRAWTKFEKFLVDILKNSHQLRQNCSQEKNCLENANIIFVDKNFGKLAKKLKLMTLFYVLCSV